MLSITYVSTAAVPFGDPEIKALLRASRESNTARGLTGMLLFKGDQFMQVLEGDDDEVQRLYAVIKADPRHTDVKILTSSPIRTRQFSEWSMGYQAVSDESIKEIPGYDDFFDASPGRRRTWAEPSKAQWLLDWFRTRAVKVRLQAFLTGETSSALPKVARRQILTTTSPLRSRDPSIRLPCRS